MVDAMGRMIDAFWRAVAYCLHPRVIALSLLPLLVAACLTVGMAYYFWEPAIDAVRATLESWSLIDSMLSWLDYVGAGALRAALAPLLVLAFALPVIVIVSLLLVALLMTPALVNLVAARRFPNLERRRGAPLWKSIAWAFWHALLALVALLFSMPFWLIPPLALILPPLIWGWLGYKVFAYDVLADHASAEERMRLLTEHKVPLLTLGVITGYLGAAPAMIWAFSVVVIAAAPFLILASIWLYTLVFAFSTLWFSHYALAALQTLREEALEALDADTTPRVTQIELPTELPALLPPS